MCTLKTSKVLRCNNFNCNNKILLPRYEYILYYIFSVQNNVGKNSKKITHVSNNK